jgi:hypothetical protein
MMRQPVLLNRPVEPLHVGILLGIVWLDKRELDTVISHSLL